MPKPHRLLISLEEAQQLVYNTPIVSEVITVDIAQSLGAVLAEDIIADRNYPPADRAMMDGFCVKIEDFQEGNAVLKYQKQVAAGDRNLQQLEKKSAIQIMTGGVVSQGSDAVVKIENCQLSGDQVIINEPDLKQNLNIVREAEYSRQANVLVKKGNTITASIIATCASVGKKTIKVYKKPSIAILATGNEILPIDQKPETHQIRESNSYALAALCETLGIKAKLLGIAEDTLDDLKEKILEGLKQDVFILTGGVSMGKFDLVPQALDTENVENIFHKVKIKPGKPIWYGQSQRKRLVFALPGNPVSSQVNFKLFVEPMIRKICGETDFKPKYLMLPMHETVQNPFPLALFSQAVIQVVNDKSVITPIDIKGSGDFTQLSNSQGFFLCPSDKNELKKDQYAEFYLWK